MPLALRTFSSSLFSTFVSVCFISARSLSSSSWYFCRSTLLFTHAPSGADTAATRDDTIMVVSSALIVLLFDTYFQKPRGDIERRAGFRRKLVVSHDFDGGVARVEVKHVFP